MGCVHALATAEGPHRWARLLHSACLQLSATTPPATYAALIPALLPATIEHAPTRDVEVLGEALVSHLADAAALRAVNPTNDGVRARHNLAALLGAWPPSDKTISALHQSFGGRGGGGEGGSEGGSAMLQTASHEAGVRRGLQAHANRARGKCAGSALEALSATLKACSQGEEAHGDDDDDDEADEGAEGVGCSPTAARRTKRRRGAARDVDAPDERTQLPPSAEDLAEAGRLARAALEAIKENRPLYDAARLPTLVHRKGKAKGKA